MYYSAKSSLIEVYEVGAQHKMARIDYDGEKKIVIAQTNRYDSFAFCLDARNIHEPVNSVSSIFIGRQLFCYRVFSAKSWNLCYQIYLFS